MKRTPLARKAPLRAKRAAPRRSERTRDTPYLLAVKRLPCVARDISPCWGAIEADHAGTRPLGRKCDDHQTIAMCSHHHRCRHDFTGPFRWWSRRDMREFLDAAIEATQRVLAAPEAA